MNPIISDIKNAFSRENLKHDVPAGLVVFLVALPLCLGIALASGAPLFSGLITGIVGGLVVSLLSGTSLSVSGPAAGLTVIIISALEKMGSIEAFLLSVILAGILQVIMGAVKAGGVGKFFPSSVIKGMLAAIGLILILKQIPHAFGYDADYEGDFSFFQSDNENTFSEILIAVNKTNPGAIIISVISLFVLIIWERPMFKKFKLLPGPLVVVILGILINRLFVMFDTSFAISAEHLVTIPSSSNVKEFFSFFTFPDFSQITNPQVYITAFTLAIVASLETLLSVEAIDKLDPQKRKSDNNRELKAQGIGNIIAGFLGGLPMTAVIVRGSANVNSGAKGRASSFFHGLFLLLSVVFLAPVLNEIPLSALAAILLMVGYKLTKVSLFKDLYAQGWLHFIPFTVTIIAILFTDLLVGITIGMVVGLLFILYKNAGNSFYLHQKESTVGNIYTLILAEEVTFLNKATISNKLESFPQNSTVIIDGARAKFVDDDVLEILYEYKEKSVYSNIRVEMTGFQGVHRTGKSQNHNHKDANFEYKQLFINNRQWIQTQLNIDPLFFERLAEGQNPPFLLIGCSDSRFHPNEITGTNPGEMFTHRNIANLVLESDNNLMSVLQYSVEVLKIKHIIVCGHYECGGIKGAMEGGLADPIDSWLNSIRQTYEKYRDILDAESDPRTKNNMLVEYNVLEQVNNLYNNKIIKKAISAGTDLYIHAWVYDIHKGTIKELQVDANRILVNL